MAEQKVELRKIRDFSEILNDTFSFIKQNLKPLLVSFVAIAGIFMLASAILSGLSQNRLGGILENIVKGKRNSSDAIQDVYSSSTHILVPILAWLNIVAMKAVLISYVKVYEEKQKETPELNEVWAMFSKYFLKVFLYSIPVVLAIGAGTIFCFLPGLYLWVVLLPFEMILLIEDQGFGGSWDRCFTIIKENWWPSFGIYAVAYLIYMAGTYIIGGLMSAITGVFTYFTTKDFSSTFGLVTSILNIFSFVFFIVFYLAAILNYFSLVEKYDGTGMMRRLDNLGDNTSSHQIEEQY